MIYAIVEMSGTYYCRKFWDLCEEFQDWVTAMTEQGTVVSLGDEPDDICDELQIDISEVEMA